jgi:hypothetical protein
MPRRVVSKNRPELQRATACPAMSFRCKQNTNLFRVYGRGRLRCLGLPLQSGTAARRCEAVHRSSPTMRAFLPATGGIGEDPDAGTPRWLTEKQIHHQRRKDIR